MPRIVKRHQLADQRLRFRRIQHVATLYGRLAGFRRNRVDIGRQFLFRKVELRRVQYLPEILYVLSPKGSIMNPKAVNASPHAASTSSSRLEAVKITAGRSGWEMISEAAYCFIKRS